MKDVFLQAIAEIDLPEHIKGTIGAYNEKYDTLIFVQDASGANAKSVPADGYMTCRYCGKGKSEVRFKTDCHVLAESILQHGREPSIQEIAEETELTEEIIRLAARANLAHSISCLESVPEDLFPANERFQPERVVEAKHLLESLKRAVSDSTTLDEREKKILFSRYLVPITERKKLRELAADLKISTSRLHRIERKAVKKFREKYGDCF